MNIDVNVNIGSLTFWAVINTIGVTLLLASVPVLNLLTGGDYAYYLIYGAAAVVTIIATTMTVEYACDPSNKDQIFKVCWIGFLGANTAAAYCLILTEIVAIASHMGVHGFHYKYGVDGGPFSVLLFAVKLYVIFAHVLNSFSASWWFLASRALLRNQQVKENLAKKDEDEKKKEE